MTERDEAGLIQQLQDKIKDIEPLKDDPYFKLDEHTLRRYLETKNWDLAGAEKQLKGTIEWRRETKPQHVVCSHCQKQPGFHAMRQIGFDLKNRPVFYACFVQNLTQKNTPEDSEQHLIHVMETAIRIMEPEVHQIVWIFDFTGMKLESCSPRLALATFKLLSHYPGQLAAVVCVNHGFIFQGLWRAVKHFSDPEAICKVYVERSRDKVEEVLSTVFPVELKEWLEKEMLLNKSRPPLDTQKQFWKTPTGDHDPRGCPSFVSKYIDTIDIDGVENGNHLFRPHPSILEYMKQMKLGN